MAAACPPGFRGCDLLFQLSPHMHDRPKNSSYRNRGGPREAIEAKRGVVESQTDGAFDAPTFLSLHTHRLHLRYFPSCIVKNVITYFHSCLPCFILAFALSFDPVFRIFHPKLVHSSSQPPPHFCPNHTQPTHPSSGMNTFF